MCNSRYMPARQQLLEKCLKHLLRHGVANLSLRPLAAAAGTSARMLVHHFGSKEKLIAAVMEKVHVRFQASLQANLRQAANASAGTAMLDFWKFISAPANLGYMRLLFEVQMLAIQNPRRYVRYLAHTSSSWLRLILTALPGRKDRRARATLFAAVVDGLMLELLATGDIRRTTRALRLFVKQKDNSRS